MIVWRIENEKGEGPYAANVVMDRLSTGFRPSPDCDGICWLDWRPREWFFGFPSLEALQRWFDDYCLEVFHDMGLRLAIYEVDDEAIAIGRRQVVFEKKRSRLVREKELLYGTQRSNEEIKCGRDPINRRAWGWDLES